MPIIDPEPVDKSATYESELRHVGWLATSRAAQTEQHSWTERISKLQETLQNLDVVVVIDHTASMRPFFPMVADAVENIVDDLKKNHLSQEGIRKLQMRLSISFYGVEGEASAAHAVIRELAEVKAGDAPLDGNERGNLSQLEKATRLTVPQMLAELPVHPDRGGGCIESDVLDGAIRAARLFPQDDRQKLLIVVGDMGDQTYRGQKYEALRDDLVAWLTKRSVPIRLVVLHVPSEETSRSENAKSVAKLYCDQFRDVIQCAARAAAERGFPEYDKYSLLIDIQGDAAATRAGCRRHQEPVRQPATRDLAIPGKTEPLRGHRIRSFATDRLATAATECQRRGIKQGYLSHFPRRLHLEPRPSGGSRRRCDWGRPDSQLRAVEQE